MDLWQLHIFCKVVEQRSFSKAGKLVHLTQPTVSSHIKELETHLGCRLIDRLAKEAVPTREGELLYEYALKLIALRDEIETAVRGFKDQISGSLMIGGSTIPGGYILPRAIGGFLQRHPDVYPSMKVSDTAEIIQDIQAGNLEIGVVGARLPDRPIRQQKLLEDELRLILLPDHPLSEATHITLEMLLGERFIIRESGSGTLKSLTERLQAHDHRIEDLRIVAELGSTEAVVSGIKNGVGLSILSPIAVSEELEAGTVIALPIEGIDLKRSFYLTHHKYRSLSPPAQAFAQYLLEVLSSR
jgi:DNA-binding transcriptional LysR family regulator